MTTALIEKIDSILLTPEHTDISNDTFIRCRCGLHAAKCNGQLPVKSSFLDRVDLKKLDNYQSKRDARRYAKYAVVVDPFDFAGAPAIYNPLPSFLEELRAKFRSLAKKGLRLQN